MLTTGDQHDLVAGTMQQRADDTPDSPCSIADETHPATLPKPRLNRCPLHPHHIALRELLHAQPHLGRERSPRLGR